MTRRDFSRGLVFAIVAIPAGRILAGCGGDGALTLDEAPTGAGEGSMTFTSSVVSGHAHTFTLDAIFVDDSPATGIPGRTGTVEKHSHSVVLSQEELDAIAAGGAVEKNTSLSNAHLHRFVFVRA
jgi:hypothetical protein